MDTDRHRYGDGDTSFSLRAKDIRSLVSDEGEETFLECGGLTPLSQESVTMVSRDN